MAIQNVHVYFSFSQFYSAGQFLGRYVDAAYCYRRSRVFCLSVCLSVCRSVTLVIPAKTAEHIELPSGLWTPVGLRNHVLDAVEIPMQSGNFEGEWEAHCKLLK